MTNLALEKVLHTLIICLKLSFDSVLALTQVMLRWRVFGSSRQACHCFPLLKTGCGHSVLAYH